MRRAAALAALAAILGGAWAAWQILHGGFRLSGSILATPRYQKLIETPNMTLFVVAENSGNVPVAVKRFVNPRLPLNWRMGPEDLILPGRDWAGTLSVRVLVNANGKVGELQRGDLHGEHRHPVHSGDRSVDVVIDAQVE